MRSTKNWCWRGERVARQFALTMALVAMVAMPAAATVINFESVSDLEPVAAQFDALHGVTFENSVALQEGVPAGGSLNELEFPARSGVTVITGNDVAFGGAGPLVIDFVQPMTSVGAYFTYEAQVTLSVFDDLGHRLGTMLSGAASNMALTGSGSPNEWLAFSGVGDISELRVESPLVSDLGYGERLAFYTLDDLTFERAAPVNGVPEPSTLLLLVVAGVVGLTRRRGLPAG